MSIVINDILPLDQFTASASQTVFSVTWTVDETTDVVVYARASGTESDDATDIVTSGYTVTLVGGTEAVRVTFDSGRTVGDIITITRATPATRDNLYINTNFTPSMLNGDFKRLVLIEQQNQVLKDALGPRYNISSTLNGTVDTILPILGADQTWVKNTADTAIVASDFPSVGAAPLDATYLLQIADSDLPNAQDIGSLTSGILVGTTTTGVVLSRELTGTSEQIDVTYGDGISGDPTISLTDNLTMPGISHFYPPQGTTAERPASPLDGMVRYNTTLGALEVYESSAWDPLSGGVVDTVTGTTNQVDVDSTDGANPIVSLSSTADIPGTFTIQSTTAIDSIIDDDTMATASATNVPTAESVVAYVSTAAVAAGGSTTQVQYNNAGTLGGDSGFTTDGAGSLTVTGDLSVDNINLDANTISITDTNGDLNLAANGTGDIKTNDFDLICGDPGTEASGININGVTYDSVFKVSNIDGGNEAQFIMHRHSTTLQPLLIGSRSNSDDTSHSPVTSGQSLFSIYAAGWTASHYDLFGAIDISVDTTGTVSATSSPGRMRFQVTPESSNTPVTWLTATNDGSAAFAGDVTIGSGSSTLLLNSSTAIDGVIDDDTMATASATNVPTAESVVSYVTTRTPTLTNGQLWIGDTGNEATASTLTAGTGVTIVNTAGTITLSSVGGGYSWTEVTGTTQAMSSNNGYILNNVALITATLPATASVGDTFILQGKGAGLYKIAQNASQTIHFGSSDTTTGTGGSLTATNQYDSIELICITENSDFAVLTGSQGSYTVA